MSSAHRSMHLVSSLSIFSLLACYCMPCIAVKDRSKRCNTTCYYEPIGVTRCKSGVLPAEDMDVFWFNDALNCLPRTHQEMMAIVNRCAPETYDSMYHCILDARDGKHHPNGYVKGTIYEGICLTGHCQEVLSHIYDSAAPALELESTYSYTDAETSTSYVDVEPTSISPFPFEPSPITTSSDRDEYDEYDGTVTLTYTSTHTVYSPIEPM